MSIALLIDFGSTWTKLRDENVAAREEGFRMVDAYMQSVAA